MRRSRTSRPRTPTRRSGPGRLSRSTCASRWNGNTTSKAPCRCPAELLEFAADPASPRHNAELDPNRRVIVYCRSGTRAVLAAHTLKTMGFDNVANLEGGFGAWTKAGLPEEEHHADL